jgi:hypothetical protein
MTIRNEGVRVGKELDQRLTADGPEKRGALQTQGALHLLVDENDAPVLAKNGNAIVQEM